MFSRFVGYTELDMALTSIRLSVPVRLSRAEDENIPGSNFGLPKIENLENFGKCDLSSVVYIDFFAMMGGPGLEID